MLILLTGIIMLSHML